MDILDPRRRIGLALAGHISRQKIAVVKHRQELELLSAGPLTQLVTRRKAKAGKKSAMKMRREHSQSMLDMPAPKEHQLVPYLTGEKEKTLFRAHHKRLEIRQWRRHDGK